MSERWKAIVGSTFVSMLVVLVLTLSVLKEVKAVAEENRDRALASQKRWEEKRAADLKSDTERHDEIVGRLQDLTSQFQTMNKEHERLMQVLKVIPVQAMRDRAGKEQKR